jgi:hypothetical protein
VKFLEEGSCQFLPSRDAAGRVVVFMAPGYSSFEDMEDSVRTFFSFVAPGRKRIFCIFVTLIFSFFVCASS